MVMHMALALEVGRHTNVVVSHGRGASDVSVDCAPGFRVRGSAHPAVAGGASRLYIGYCSQRVFTPPES